MATDRQIVNARRLRRGSTDAKARIWRRLRARRIENAKFVRQYPIGPYIVDFCARSLMLVIEIDGGQHADDPTDLIWTDAIVAMGYVVLRFWNNDVTDNLEGVQQVIVQQVRIARSG